MKNLRKRNSSNISKSESLIHLKKDINLLEGISIITGIIVGSGIFVSPIGVLQYSNSVGMSFTMWLVSGFFSTIGALVWAELGSTITLSGGEYIYILKIFGPFPAFMSLWISFMIGSVAIAANSMIFSQYLLQPFFGMCGIPSSIVLITAMFGILMLAAINSFNVQWATKTAMIFTLCKVSALVIIIAIGGIYIIKGRTESFNEPFAHFVEQSTFSSSLVVAFYQGFWAFSGWNCLNFLTNEMKNPGRNLPLAIIASMILITILYVLVNVAYLAVFSPQEMLNIGQSSTAVAVNFADRTMGIMSWTMPIFVGLSVFGSMNSELMSLSRLTHTGAEENHMPKILAMISYKYLTPLPAVIIITLLAIVFQMYQDAFYLIELTGFAFSVIAAMTSSCLIYLRYKRPDLPRPFKLPIAVPFIFLVADLCIGILTVYEKPFDSFVALLLMIMSIPVYFVFITWKNKPNTMVKFLSSVTVNLQKLLNVVLQETAVKELCELKSDKKAEDNLSISNGHPKTNGAN